MKRIYGAVALLLVSITALSLGLTALLGIGRPSEKPQAAVSVVASFYPMYTAALQVVGDTEGVTVSCLTQPTTGCLHDYQLSPAEMAVLTEADVLVLNGAGAEEFLEQALSALPDLYRIDTSAGLSVLHASHEHEHEDHEHEDHEHEANEHVWMDPDRYAQQIQTLCDGLCQADAAHAAEYTANAARYMAQVRAVGDELKSVLQRGPRKAVLFHDSLAYLAEAAGITAVGHLPIGEESGFSAAELTEVADAITGQEVWFLYDSQYERQQEALAESAARAISVTLNSAVQAQAGVSDAELWLTAMRENIAVWKEAVA